MTALGMIDAGFLLAETARQPMHVGGLTLLDPPRGVSARRVADDALGSLLAHADAAPPFNQRATWRMGLWRWEPDRDFDIARHVRRLTLPSPGTDATLRATVAQLHGEALARDHPLWQLYVIDGLASGQLAVYGKIHHALADGVTALRWWARATSRQPTVQPAPFWTRAVPARPAARGGWSMAGAALRPFARNGRRRLLMGAVRSVAHVGAEMARSWYAHGTDNDYVSFSQAPRTLFNRRIGATRSFATASFALAEMTAAARRCGVTLNDLALELCADALRHYLIERGELPDAPLIAMVPLSLRGAAATPGNRVAMTLANLGTHLARPRSRLEVIHRSMADGKQRARRLSPAELMTYLGMQMSPHGLNLALGLDPGWQAFNLIVSNVPGPRGPRYWGAARIAAQYPLSIVIDGAALNITLNSFGERLDFGLTACPVVVPDLDALAGHIHGALDPFR
ncbi:MAG TPA: wax ester/triacylglycerol synthase family O-acyltransferase [Nevskiaceae bacterium]